MFTLPPFIFFQAAGHLLYLYYRKQTLLYMKRFVIGILAHVDAGKTTMSEAILYETGKLKKMGRVDNRDAFLDTFALERARGITIFSKQAVFPLGDASVTLLDTPSRLGFPSHAHTTLFYVNMDSLRRLTAQGLISVYLTPKKPRKRHWRRLHTISDQRLRWWQERTAWITALTLC